MEHGDPDVLSLNDYVRVLSRQRWIVILVVVVTVGAALAVSFSQSPVYESRAQLVLRPAEAARSASILDQVVFNEVTLQTERRVMESPELASRVREALGTDESVESLTGRVSASVVRDSQVIEVAASAGSPERAAQVAQTFAEQYLEYRRERVREETAAAAETLEGRVVAIRERIQELRAEERIASEDEQQAIESSRLALLSQLAQLETQITELRTAATPTGGGEIIQPATVPGSPASPQPLRTGVLALVLGLMLGVGLAFLRDHVADSIADSDDAARVVGGPVLGHVPRWSGPSEGKLPLVTLTDPTSPVSEAYRALRTNVRFMLAANERRQSLLVTSATQGEGKTTTAANLAVSFVVAGASVILVDADLRRPMVAKAFGVPREPGLSDYLRGEADVVDVVRDAGDLRLVTAGQSAPNPTELLMSEAMVQLIQELEELADVVIIDAPPVLAVADTVELGMQVGGVLMVLNSGVARRREVRTAAHRLTAVGADVLGSVLNNVEKSDGYYGYYYSDYLQSGTPEPVGEPS